MSAPPTATIADVLNEAARIIRRNGWHQGFYYDRSQNAYGTRFDQCRVCARGAINLAVAPPDSEDLRRQAIYAVAAVERWLDTNRPQDDTYSLAAWNDEAGRTVDEVLAALEYAARAERTKAGAA